VNLYQVIRKPLVTEKSNIGRETQNLVTLAVDLRASKHDVRRAVEQLFGVDVLDVRTLRMPHKSRRVGRFLGRKTQWKKAIVRLAEGQKIEFYEGV
jgi:large subunit ribosomal protein L23